MDDESVVVVCSWYLTLLALGRMASTVKMLAQAQATAGLSSHSSVREGYWRCRRDSRNSRNVRLDFRSAGVGASQLGLL